MPRVTTPAYPLEPDCIDEAFGRRRLAATSVYGAVGGAGARGSRRRCSNGSRQRSSPAPSPSARKADPGRSGPRLIAAEEWERLEAGCCSGPAPSTPSSPTPTGRSGSSTPAWCRARLLETSSGYAPAMEGLLDPEVPPATVAGLDLVRDQEGELQVLEDNLRMPSGACYALAVREIVAPRARGRRPAARRSAATWRSCGEAIRAAAPHGRDEPVAVILSDGPENGAWYEHERVGRDLGLPIVTPDQLEARRGRLFARVERDAPAGRRDLPPPRHRPPHRADGSLTAARRAAAAGAARGPRCAASTPSAPASPTTSSTHAYVERMIDSTSARSRCCARCRATTSATRSPAKRRWSGWRNW